MNSKLSLQMEHAASLAKQDIILHRVLAAHAPIRIVYCVSSITQQISIVEDVLQDTFSILQPTRAFFHVQVLPNQLLHII